MNAFEKALISNYTDNVNIEDFEIEDGIKDDISSLWQCNWLNVINKSNSIQYLENDQGTEYERLILAETFLLAFIQENFTGPSLTNEYKTFLENNWPKNMNANQELIIDSEELNPNVRYPEFLLSTKLLLENINENSELIFKWWKIRYILIHQSCLDDLVHSLYKEFCALSDSLINDVEKIENLELQGLLLIEIAQIHIVFHHVQKSKEILEKIQQNLGIHLDIEGLLGYRTKFQQKPLPQLFLKIKQENNGSFPTSKETNGNIVLPKLLQLNDEVRLEKIKFLSDTDSEMLKIPSIVQALNLTEAKFLLKSQPEHHLANEMLEPYLTTLLHQENGPLSIRLKTLQLNIHKEANHKRTVERSLKQCEELLHIIEGNKYSVKDRLSYVFASFLTPKWIIQKQMGDLMISLGFVKTALDLYIEIQLWEDVIECYTKLNLRHKAAEIIENELKKKETVKLYCLLGDTTDNPIHYETAWKLSKETSGRVQRHWGSYYFNKKEYEKALPHLQKSLEINSLQEIIWLKYGYSALILEKWDIAVQAYLRYTHIEPNGFESWNNLAKALIKLGDKKRAHKILQEALKCNFNNWKIWENFMNVSIDTGNFEDTVNAYNRLIELKEKFIDVEILELLVNAVLKNLPDAHGKPIGDRLKKKISQLLSNQCLSHRNEGKLWELSSCLADTALSKAEKLLKSYHTYTQMDTSWSVKNDKRLKLMNLLKDLCKYTLEAIENYDVKMNLLSQLSSTRLCLQGCIKIVEKNLEVDDTNYELIKSLLEELKILLETITEELKKMH